MKTAGFLLMAIGMVIVAVYMAVRLQKLHATRGWQEPTENPDEVRYVPVIPYSGIALMVTGAALVATSRRRLQ
jgi:hypothetical protein